MTKQHKGMAAVVLLMLVLCPAQALAGGDASLVFGRKSIGDSTIEQYGADSQTEMGVAVSMDFDWPVMLAVDLLASSGDKTIVVSDQPRLEFWTDVETTELDVGVRKYWGKKKLKPYIGGGLAYVQLESIQIESGDLGFPGSDYFDTIIDDSDSSIGFWLNAGFLYRVGQYLNIGVDIRHSDADADLLPFDADTTLNLDSGGTHYGVLFGYHW
jgi:opacity protein-like surface antigen